MAKRRPSQLQLKETWHYAESLEISSRVWLGVLDWTAYPSISDVEDVPAFCFRFEDLTEFLSIALLFENDSKFCLRCLHKSR